MQKFLRSKILDTKHILISVIRKNKLSNNYKKQFFILTKKISCLIILHKFTWCIMNGDVYIISWAWMQKQAIHGYGKCSMIIKWAKTWKMNLQTSQFWSCISFKYIHTWSQFCHHIIIVNGVPSLSYFLRFWYKKWVCFIIYVPWKKCMCAW